MIHINHSFYTKVNHDDDDGRERVGEVPLRAVLAGEETQDLHHRIRRIHRLPPRATTQGRGPLHRRVRLEEERTHDGT